VKNLYCIYGIIFFWKPLAIHFFFHQE
jgi:hypothetical protein